MPEYPIGIEYHEPEWRALWERGVIEDYESSTCLFVEADSVDDAVKWTEEVAAALFRFVHHDDTVDWRAAGHSCWFEGDFENSGWQDAKDFFQHVRVGEWPAIENMTSDAFGRWLDQHTVVKPPVA